MKNLLTIFKMLLFPFLFILFSTFTYADDTNTDNFGGSLENWLGDVTRVSYNGSNQMRIDADGTASKTFPFDGTTYGGATTTIAFDLTLNGEWENSGGAQDYIDVYVNNVLLATYSHSANYSGRKTITTGFANGSGDVPLRIETRNTANNEDAYIDNVSVTVHTPVAGPTVCPGTVLPNIDGTAVTATDSFNNVSVPANTIYYYSFTPTAAGTIQTNSDATNTTNSLYIYSGCGGALLWSDTSSGTDKSSPNIDVSANQQIVIAFERDYTSSTTLDIDFTYTVIVPAPPVIDPISNQTASVSIPFTLTVTATDPNNDTITFSASGLPAGLAINPLTGEISGTPTVVGISTVTVTATDPGGLSDTEVFDIDVRNPDLVATNNTYSITPGASITGNFITDDTGNGVDSGLAPIVASSTPTSGPSQGTVTILPDGTFTYTPNSTSTVSDSFTYTITDSIAGRNSTATVTITVTVQETTGSELPFYLINPDNTRNIVGNYAIAGNTVLCLTEKEDGYGGTCHGHTDYQFETSNRKVSKYLDIDNDNSTWASTSSNITFPSSYDATAGVLWAGLFWGGRISADGDYDIRYAKESGSTFTYVETGDGTGVDDDDIDLINEGADEIKLKIDNGAYSNASAATFHVYQSGGGKTYAAYADVTSLLGGLAGGAHTFTVANLTTMEGREPSPGAFGGWSLVVIYAEDFDLGKPRNISIYNGFVSIDENNDPISISGFKLPKTGDIDAQLSIFSGEGEHRYGRTTSSNNEDWMKISDNYSSNYSYMPGLTSGTHVGNRDNSFNAQIDGIDRDNIAGEYNDLAINNVGVDIDNYDVSALMSTYRDNNIDINEIFIKTYSDNDYITSSMVAYSAELYVPKLCYDYTLAIAGYVLTSVDNQINTPFGGFGLPLTTHIFLQSLEGDIDLKDVNVSYTINDTSELTYTFPPTCTTEISETGNFDYTDACPYTVNQSVSGFDMYIGTGKTATSGGIIAANQQRYLVWDSNFMQSNVSTSFDFAVNYTVNYGSGAVPLEQRFTSADLCDANDSAGGYYPDLGFFNVVDGYATDHNTYNLYTQVSQRPFPLTVYAYDATTPTDLISTDLNLTVEVEMIRADNFYRDAVTACNDEYSILSEVPPVFAHFDGKSADIAYDAADINLAYRSVAMRIWYLTDVDGNGNLVDDHACTRDFSNKSECEDLYAREYFGTDTSCTIKCASGSAWTELDNCYTCLRSTYGRKVCSRDNFAIRPESFIIDIRDSNQSISIDDPNIHIANSVTDAAPFSVIAGYDYRFDINATNHQNNTSTPRYIQHFEPGSATHRVRMVPIPSFKANTACNDVEDKNITINLFNGSDVNPISRTSYIDSVEQIGEYSFEIFDSNWTSADWDPSKMGHHADFSSYYASGPDCASGSAVLATGTSGRNGCEISSVHDNVDTGVSYQYLYAQFYPYQFVDNLSFTAGPRGSSGFVYVNTLNTAAYPNGVDENMSYNIQGTFMAAGYDDGNVSNFVENCYAEDVNMSLYQSFQHATPGITPNLTYDLIDYNTSDSTVVIRTREQNTFAFSNDTSTALPLPPLVIFQGAEFFKKDMIGAITMDLGYNFDRRIDTVLNPRLIQMNDFNISYRTPPPMIHVDLKTDHKIFGNSQLDQNVSFYYGRTKPGKFFYEDVTVSPIFTPVSVVAYCDLGFTICQDRMRILLSDAGTSEANWWLSLDHRTTMGTDEHGNIVLQRGAITEGAGNPTVTPASPNALTIITDATDGTVSVSSGTNPTLPMTVEIDLDTNGTSAGTYTDRWLIYNEYSNTVPSPFYKVRFIGDSNWTGIGNEGMVVGTEASKRKTKRLDW